MESSQKESNMDEWENSGKTKAEREGGGKLNVILKSIPPCIST